MTENQTGGMRTAALEEGTDVAQHAKEAAGQVGSTVKDQAAAVTHETANQARQVVQDVRHRVAGEAEEQATRVSKQLGRIADELGQMAGSAAPDSMSAGAIQSVADTSRQAARFLDERGAQGLLDSARDYARRKPGTFLLGAAVAGFLVGRIAKGASGGSPARSGPQSSPQGGGFVPVAAERPDVAPEYGTPEYGTPEYGTPEYGTPEYGTPGYGTPGYGTPGYVAPTTPTTTPVVPPAGVPHVGP
ncbi:hypothetical protein [Lentzea cavernae]|uniref:DUF3618 domain-containing protein n=1 Tax=Lentzea cavernae TaxID=2020703 RepID=A0ABQ3M4M5_9PSEU|nr:hypothetical protein [Lentzea cavernae]GHH33574.1 hypothetical protein GCM10017774_16220 [Lentzea cavernae]